MNINTAYSQHNIWPVQELQRVWAGIINRQLQGKTIGGQAQPFTKWGDTVSISPEAMALARNQVKPVGYGKTAREVMLVLDPMFKTEVPEEILIRMAHFKELNSARMELVPAAYVRSNPEVIAADEAIAARSAEINDAYMRGEISADEARRRSAVILASTPRLMGPEDYAYQKALDATWAKVTTEMGLVAKPGEDLPEYGPEQIKAVKEEVSRRLLAAGFGSLMQYYGIQL